MVWNWAILLAMLDTTPTLAVVNITFKICVTRKQIDHKLTRRDNFFYADSKTSTLPERMETGKYTGLCSEEVHVSAWAVLNINCMVSIKQLLLNVVRLIAIQFENKVWHICYPSLMKLAIYTWYMWFFNVLFFQGSLLGSNIGQEEAPNLYDSLSASDGFGDRSPWRGNIDYNAWWYAILSMTMSISMIYWWHTYFSYIQ